MVKRVLTVDFSMHSCLLKCINVDAGVGCLQAHTLECSVWCCTSTGMGDA